jgi:hypothetical protein
LFAWLTRPLLESTTSYYLKQLIVTRQMVFFCHESDE